MDQTVENLTVTGTITVKHPDAKYGLTISANETGAGIWIGDGRYFVAIHHISGQCCLALASRKDKSGHAFAISIDKDGEPSLQLCRPGGECLFLTGDRLQSLFAKASPVGSGDCPGCGAPMQPMGDGSWKCHACGKVVTGGEQAGG